MNALARRGVSIALACRAFEISEMCNRYSPVLNDEKKVDFSLPAERVVRSLNQIIEWRGQPQAIRVDIGPEHVSAKLMEWAEKRNVRLEYIQPGKPQQNA